MSDDTRALFDDSLETIRVPSGSPADAARRGRTYVRRRRLARTLSLAVLLGAGGIVAGNVTGGNQTTAPPATRSGADQLVDDRASRIIEALGPVCRGFDFYYKTPIGPELYRPVQCGMHRSVVAFVDSRLASPSAAPTPSLAPPEVRLVRGPLLVVYAFSSPGAATFWMESHPPFRGGRIAGRNWVVDVVARSTFEAVRDELAAGRVVARPDRAWRVRDHVVTDVPRGFAPVVSLRRASRGVLARHREILAAELGTYATGTSRPRPAWIITVRRCVPQYGGAHAAPNCAPDRAHIVVHARSGRRIARF
jgi:hypothetical protein